MSEISAVLYTDGGADSPRGAGGSGISGYTYEKGKTIDPPTGADYHPTTMGWYSKTTLPKGAEWVQPLEVVEGLVSYPMPVTNNIAELGAAQLAFSEIKNKGWSTVLIRPDSKYVMDGYQNSLDKWRKNGWVKSDGEEVKNQPYWEKLWQYKYEFNESEVRIDWSWVKGHSDDPGNQRADALATQGKEHARLAQAVSEIRWTAATVIDRDSEGVVVPAVNKMFGATRWYFTNAESAPTVTPDGKYVYYCGAHGKDDELAGKLMSESTHCVLYLAEPDPVLEKIRERQSRVNPNGYCEVVIGHLDNIFNSKVYESVFRNGAQWIDPHPGTNNLLSANNQLLTRECSPARLAFNTLRNLTEAEALLGRYRAGKLNGEVATDITSLIFDSIEKKTKVEYKIKPELTTASKTLDVDLNYDVGAGVKTDRVRVILGTDLPRRNTLAALAKRNPKVTLLTWKHSAHSYCFACVVEAEDDVAIWIGSPANLRVIKQE